MKTSVLLVSAALFAAGADTLPVRQILYLTGAASMEELDESVISRFETYAARPLGINLESRRTLSASGLFSAFQVASIVDYRSRYGDILSEIELSLLPGFSGEDARALSPFVDYASAAAPGTSSLEGRSMGEGALRLDDKGLSARAVYRRGESLQAAAALRNSEWTGSLSWRDAGGALSLTAGDFNVRYGQGLSAWTAFSLSSLTSLQAFCRRGYGITPGTSFSRSTRLRGFCAEIGMGESWSGMGLVAKTPQGAWTGGANFSLYGRNGQAGLNMLGKSCSLDGRLTLDRFDLFGEVAYDFGRHSLSAVGGCIWNRSYDVKLGLHASLSRGEGASSALGARIYGTDAVIGTEYRVSWGGMQGRLSLNAPLQLFPWWLLTLRFDYRRRSWDSHWRRSDLRADSRWTYDHFSTELRAETVRSARGASLLLLSEQGWSSGVLSLYLRGSLFRVDRWDERIYVWQRDVLGTFNVPAMYGRGWTIAFYGCWKGRWGKLSLRAAKTTYITDKAPKLELRCQYSFTF